MRTFAEELLALIEARVEAVCFYQLTDDPEPRDLEGWQDAALDAELELDDLLTEARRLLWLHQLEQTRGAA
jgi:hypothetical protein